LNIVITERTDDLLKFLVRNVLKADAAFHCHSHYSRDGLRGYLCGGDFDPDRHLKMSFTSNFLYPRAAILIHE
jgi:hypothetical protein